MTFFENPKHKNFFEKIVHDNILELKVYSELKLSLIQWLDEED